MKKMITWFSAHLLAAFYALALGLTLLCCLFAAAWDGIGFATGRLHTETISLDALSAQDILVTPEGLWVTTSTDPQLVLAADQQIRTILWQTNTPAALSEAEGYYAADGHAFGLRQRVWAKAVSGDGTECGIELDFPLTGGHSVRIDPLATAGIVFAGPGTGTQLTLNPPRSFGSYFILRSEQYFWLLVLPALAAAAVDFAREGVHTCRNLKGHKSKGEKQK